VTRHEYFIIINKEPAYYNKGTINTVTVNRKSDSKTRCSWRINQTHLIGFAIDITEDSRPQGIPYRIPCFNFHGYDLRYVHRTYLNLEMHSPDVHKHKFTLEDTLVATVNSETSLLFLSKLIMITETLTLKLLNYKLNAKVKVWPCKF
jgi:hypothetical protein